MDTISIVCQFILSLSILIVLHEMGHFAPAKWFKTRVEKFYLFFDAPPFNSLFNIKRGGTEYGIGWLPLGGYVKISGMIDESMDKEQMAGPAQPWEFRSKPAWQRLIIMIGGVTVNFLLGIFLFAMVLWHWGKEYLPTSEVQRDGMAFDSVLLKQGLRQGDFVLKVGEKPFDRVDGRDILAPIMLEDVRQITVLRDGQPQTITLSVDVVNALSGKRKRDLVAARFPFEILKAPKGKPAAMAGLMTGDRIVRFDTVPIRFFDQFGPMAEQRKGQAVTLGIIRNGEPKDISVTISEEGTIGVFPRVQGYFKTARTTYSFGEAIPAGFSTAKNFLTDQISAFGQMFRGKISVKDNLGSVISISQLFDPAWNWETFWWVTASLSIILAFMNLLPIPALDGGYVLFLIWEVITGKRVSDKFMEKAVTVGFFLLISLMVLALGLDVWRQWFK